MVSSKIPAALAISCLATANAFVVQNQAVVGNKALSMSNNESNEVEVSRRVAFAKSAATFASITSIVTGNPGFALAARSPPTEAELNRLKLGYERMTYLLENFDQETTICRVRISQHLLFFTFDFKWSSYERDSCCISSMIVSLLIVINIISLTD